MKLLKYIITLIVFMAIGVGCQKEEELTQPNDFKGVKWVLSDIEQTRERNISINDYISFVDFSIEPLSHEWKIQEEGTVFLKSKFSIEAEDYSKFIDKELGTKNTNYKANVLFTKPGIHQVKLINTFDRFVKNVFNTPAVFSVEKNGSWLYEDTFKIDVYQDIKPQAAIVYNEVETDLSTISISDESTWPTIEVEAGEPVTFKDISIGRPTKSIWELTGASPSTVQEKEAIVSFAEIESFSGFKLKIERDLTGLLEVSDSIMVPAKINVITPTKPLAINTAINIDASSIIEFGLNGKIENENFTATIANFTVSLNNSAKGVHRDMVIAAAKLSKEGTGIVLELGEPIYADDVITISYNPGADESIITDVYGRTLKAFSNLSTVKKTLSYSNEVFSFENPSAWTIPNKSKFFVGFEETDLGQSLRFESNDVGGGKGKTFSAISDKILSEFDVPGTEFPVYKVSFKIKLEKNSLGEDTTIKSVNLKLGKLTVEFDDVFGLSTGEWHTISWVNDKAFPVLSSTTGFTFEILKKSSSNDALFFVDDVNIEWLDRP
ncbi:hypothetical protein [Wenyingzhuangia aestuarii]|uniref:hypothetical protein n=1 Tax=Wenyingzhuangia aestuarii TaxID=1647582 RepID=UPI00143BFC20|nr:hypothetical protein [Wenyingzhuangia aestuarii]NJB83681.1 hypothetical protein [Wenyingzhuangia aestuarii]